MAIDSQRIEEFVSLDPSRRKIRDLLKKSGFEVSWVEEHSFKLWGFYLKPSKHVRDFLSIGSLEILVWVADFENFQARTITQAVSIASSEKRLGKDFIIVIANDPDTSDVVEKCSPQISSINIVGFSIKDIEDFGSNSEDFLKRIQSNLYIKDLYWTVNPLKIPRYFYGHNNLLSEIASSLVNSQSNIGLFGLRKMGKTSFLYRLIEILRDGYDCYFAYLDVQLLDAVSPSAEYFLWSIGRALLDSLGKKRMKQLSLFGKHESFFDIDNREAIPERFTRDFEKILKETNKQFVIAFDEIELMAPSSVIRGSNWQPQDFVRAWRVLRAISQQNPGRIAFFVTGTNPKIIEEISINEADNPIYNFFEKRYLSPFSIEDSERLLIDIGALMGLRWNSESIKLVHERTGGHPLLLRAYGSVIHNSREFKTNSKNINASDISSNSGNFIRRVEPEISQMVDVLSKYYENEFLILETLAKGRISEFREYAELFPNDISHLKGYGIIEFKETECRIKAEPLQTWINRKLPSNIVNLQRDDEERLIGKTIASYKVEALIGHSSAFSNVYRAAIIEDCQSSSGKPNLVAIKGECVNL